MRLFDVLFCPEWMYVMNGKIFNEDNMRLVLLLLAIRGLLWNFSSGINQRIDRLEDKMETKFDTVDRKLERIDARLDSFGERIAANEAKLDEK